MIKNQSDLLIDVPFLLVFGCLIFLLVKIYLISCRLQLGKKGREQSVHSHGSSYSRLKASSHNLESGLA